MLVKPLILSHFLETIPRQHIVQVTDNFKGGDWRCTWRIFVVFNADDFERRWAFYSVSLTLGKLNDGNWHIGKNVERPPRYTSSMSHAPLPGFSCANISQVSTDTVRLRRPPLRRKFQTTAWVLQCPRYASVLDWKSSPQIRLWCFPFVAVLSCWIPPRVLYE